MAPYEAPIAITDKLNEVTRLAAVSWVLRAWLATGLPLASFKASSACRLAQQHQNSLVILPLPWQAYMENVLVVSNIHRRGHVPAQAKLLCVWFNRHSIDDVPLLVLPNRCNSCHLSIQL
jgi:hypothetical protein